MLRSALAGIAVAFFWQFGALSSAEGADLCADFRQYGTTTQLPADFDLNGYHFHDDNPATPWSVTVSEDHSSLHLDSTGVEVTLPAPTGGVRLWVRTYGGPITIKFKDSQNAVVIQTETNSFTTRSEMTIFGNNLKSFVVSGGQNEAYLERVCG
ncbi:hypothetical protein ACC679_11220 [Rhizobium ruizarguesonis]